MSWKSAAGWSTGWANAVQAAENTAGTAAASRKTTRARNASGCARNAADWEGQSGQFDAEIAAAEAEQPRLRAVIAGWRPRSLAVDAALQEASSAVQEVTRLIQERRGAYLDAMDKVSRVRNDLARVESLLRTSEGRTARLTDEQREVADEARGAGRRAGRRADAVGRAPGPARGADRTTRGAPRERGRRWWRRRPPFATRRARVREELAGLRARQRTLQELEESLEGYFPGVRAVIAAASAGTLRGWYAPVSELLEVPAELETAVEVALGAESAGCGDGQRAVGARGGGVAQVGIARAAPPSCRSTCIAPTAARLGAADAGHPRAWRMDLIGYDAQYDASRPASARPRHHRAGSGCRAGAGEIEQRARAGRRIVTLEGEVVHPCARHHRRLAGQRQRTAQAQTRTAGTHRAGWKALERSANTLQRKAQEAAAELQRLDAEITALAKAAENAASAIAESPSARVATIQRDIAVATGAPRRRWRRRLAWIWQGSWRARARRKRSISTH